MLPVFFWGRKCGRRSLLRLVVTFIWAIAGAAVAVPAAAQTATPATAQTTQAQAAQDQNSLPPIRVSGNRPKHPGNVRKPYPGAQVHPAPNPVRTPPIPGNVSGPIPNSLVTNPLSGIPATPLNAVAQSASRLGLPVIETPASVDVVTAQTIQDQGYRTTTDTAQGAVGVLSGDAGGAPANFSMRGFSFGEINTLYNGIWTGPSDITTRWMGTANLDQVEFLKGPSSLITGLNAIGGAVNYVSRQPTSGPVQNEADVSVDSFGSVLTHYGSGGNTGVKGLDYRFDMSGSQLNSFIDGVDRDLTDLSGQLDYHVTDNFMVWGAVEYKKDSGQAYWGTPVVPTSFAGGNAINGVVSGTAVSTFSGDNLGPVTIDSRTLTTNYNVADNATGAQELWLRSGFEWTPLNNVTIKDQVYNWRAKANWLDSETYAFDDGAVIEANTIDRDRFFVTHDQNLIGNNLDFTADTGFFGMANRFAAQLQASRNWITFVEEGNPNDFPFDAVAVVDPSPGLYGPEFPDTRISRLTDVAGSFEDRLKITPELALIGGVRIEDLTLDRSGTNFDGTIPDGLPFSVTWTPVSYRAAYTYEPIHDLMFYSMYAMAYDPAVAGVFSITSPQLTSTRLYETGAKQQFWNGRAEWTVALYDIVQRNVFVPVNTTTTDLAGEVASKGLEVSAAVSPFEGWKLWANSAWTHARFVNFDQWSGNTPPDVAPIIVNTGASYRYKYWRWPVEIGASVRYVGPRFVFQDNLTTMDTYTTADAYAFVDIPGRDLALPEVSTVRVTFRVRNLTNVIYAQWADPGLQDQVLLGAPRTFELAASAKW
ncbi:MAG: TonB-dependent receptor [Xanthobacteraceae bacterium]